MHELGERSRIRTNYEPEEFINAYENAESLEERDQILEVFRSIDDGRFAKMLNECHNVLAHSDLDRREAFVENHSDHLIKWIKAFGTVENLNTFPRIEVE